MQTRALRAVLDGTHEVVRRCALGRKPVIQPLERRRDPRILVPQPSHKLNGECRRQRPVFLMLKNAVARLSAGCSRRSILNSSSRIEASVSHGDCMRLRSKRVGNEYVKFGLSGARAMRSAGACLRVRDCLASRKWALCRHASGRRSAAEAEHL